MVSIDKMKLVQSYVICESESVVEDAVYCEYGITLNSVGDNDHVRTVTIKGISTDRNVVETLVQRMTGQDVDPITLEYIVEDYLGEVLGL